jgi:cytochrome c-type biogenesis protein
MMLLRATPAKHDHTCGEACAQAKRPRSLGGMFLLGAGSALVISPCCTPVVAAIAGSAAATGSPIRGALLLATYAAGHAAPLFVAGNLGNGVRRLLPRLRNAQAPAIVAAVLLLALGCYYGVLA